MYVSRTGNKKKVHNSTESSNISLKEFSGIHGRKIVKIEGTGSVYLPIVITTMMSLTPLL